MPLCSFSEGAAMYDVTPIENIFLMEYLPTAPEDCLRVYLYMRMLCLHPELGGDITATAKTLNLSEDAILNAMQYWEQAGLVRKLTDRPPTFECLRVRTPSEASASSTMDHAYYRFRDFNAKLQACFKADELIAPKEYAMAAEWVNVMGFEQDAALRMVRYELDRGRGKKPESVFKRVDKLAMEWSERGVKTLEDVERAILIDTQYFRTAQAVLKRFNMRRYPTEDEVGCVERWMRDWHCTEAQILDVCKATTGAQFPSFNYLNTVLQGQVSGEADLRTALIGILKELDPKAALPTPDQLKRYAELLAEGFEEATVRLAAVQSNRKKRIRFEDMEKLLTLWRERGLFAFEAANAYVQTIHEREDILTPYFELMGWRKRPTLKDLEESLPRWQSIASDELMRYAAELSRDKKAQLAYFDKLLESWHASGVATLEAAKAQHDAVNAGAKASQAEQGTPAANPALHYDQRTYTQDDFGDDFFTDLDDAIRQEGGNPQ